MDEINCRTQPQEVVGEGDRIWSSGHGGEVDGEVEKEESESSSCSDAAAAAAATTELLLLLREHMMLLSIR